MTMLLAKTVAAAFAWSGIGGSRPGLIARSAILVLGYGYVGLVFLRQSDQDWEHRAGTARITERPG
jgi:hypothetical protein